MKIMNHLKYIIPIIILGTIFSCKQDNYKMYDGASYVQFGPTYDLIYKHRYDIYLRDTLKQFSFFYSQPETKQDTVYFDLYAIGNATNYDRSIALEQIMLDNVENAVEGVHYKAFDDKEMLKHYTLPSGTHHIRIPIVMLRDESLKSETRTLQFQVVSNKDFQSGDNVLTWRRLVFTDRLSEPQGWPVLSFLKYSVTKHEWMIKVSGKKWDAEFIKELDSSGISYWTGFFNYKLIIENAERDSREEEHLTDEFGELVKFLE